MELNKTTKQSAAACYTERQTECQDLLKRIWEFIGLPIALSPNDLTRKVLADDEADNSCVLSNNEVAVLTFLHFYPIRSKRCRRANHGNNHSLQCPRTDLRPSRRNWRFLEMVASSWRQRVQGNEHHVARIFAFLFMQLVGCVAPRKLQHDIPNPLILSLENHFSAIAHSSGLAKTFRKSLIPPEHD
jgi:hypothetical protein